MAFNPAFISPQQVWARTLELRMVRMPSGTKQQTRYLCSDGAEIYQFVLELYQSLMDAVTYIIEGWKSVRAFHRNSPRDTFSHKKSLAPLHPSQFINTPLHFLPFTNQKSHLYINDEKYSPHTLCISTASFQASSSRSQPRSHFPPWRPMTQSSMLLWLRTCCMLYTRKPGSW